ncbi:MAG: TPM domain-containing protein [Solobacterium sp.]|nr:TPM domain-containing protein [Solobacterium sp.]
MKKIYTLFLSILAFLFLSFLPIEASAANVIDHYGLLTEQEIHELNERAQQISEKYNVGLYIRIVPNKEGKDSIFQYAEYIYKRDGMGLGEEQNGYLLTICMDDRSYLTTAYGSKAHASFTDFGKELVESDVESNLRSGNYKGAMDAFLNQSEYMLEQNELGTPVDVPGATPITEAELQARKQRQRNMRIGITAGTSPLASLLICLGLRRRHKTKGLKHDASAYIPKNGLNLQNVKDIYLYSTESRTLIVDTSSKGSSGGGTSINSGGFSHGSGGHF